MLYFGGQRDWGKGVHCGNVSVKNNTKCTNLSLFFLFLLYLTFILGRIDGSHFLVYIKNDPTLPLNSQKNGPMAVGGGGKTCNTFWETRLTFCLFVTPKTTKPTF